MAPSRQHTKKDGFTVPALFQHYQTSAVFTFWPRLCTSNQQGWKQILQLYKNVTLQQVKLLLTCTEKMYTWKAHPCLHSK